VIALEAILSATTELSMITSPDIKLSSKTQASVIALYVQTCVAFGDIDVSVTITTSLSFGMRPATELNSPLVGAIGLEL
jgi:hypothetical protein